MKSPGQSPGLYRLILPISTPKVSKMAVYEYDSRPLAVFFWGSLVGRDWEEKNHERAAGPMIWFYKVDEDGNIKNGDRYDPKDEEVDFDSNVRKVAVDGNGNVLPREILVENWPMMDLEDEKAEEEELVRKGKKKVASPGPSEEDTSGSEYIPTRK